MIVRFNKAGDKNHGKTGEVQGFLLWRKTPTYCVHIDGRNYDYPASHIEYVDDLDLLAKKEDK